MSVGQQIYFAIELFSPQSGDRDRFCRQMSRIFASSGTKPLLARQIASVLAEALSAPCVDYHLEMAHLITFHPPLTELLQGERHATEALHYYMTYFLDVLAGPVGAQRQYGIN